MNSILILHLRAAIGVIALSLFAGANLRAANVDAHVFSVTGTVESAPPASSSFSPLKKGDTLPIGSTVRTGDDGVAVLVTTPGSAIQIGNSSVVKINKLAFARRAATSRSGRPWCN